MKPHVGCSIPIDVAAVGTRNVFWKSANRDGSWRTLFIRLRQKEGPDWGTAVSAINKHFRVDFHLLLPFRILYKFAGGNLRQGRGMAAPRHIFTPHVSAQHCCRIRGLLFFSRSGTCGWDSRSCGIERRARFLHPERPLAYVQAAGDRRPRALTCPCP